VNQPAICHSGLRGFTRPALLILAVCGLASCSRSPDGPPRFVLSGSVTFDGQPVRAGFITLSPSADRGNQGPGGGAPIVNGRYSTPREKGIVGGAYDVRIIGYDGKAAVVEGEELPDGSPLFPPFETTVDLSKSDSVKDFEVPKPAPPTE
jgi:hypothetical protein